MISKCLSTFKKSLRTLHFGAIACLLLFTSCEDRHIVISGLEEREANLIVVFLESKGIKADKLPASTGNEIGGQQTGPKFNISVGESQSIEAMAILNRNGLPRKQGVTLLELFAKQGLMSSDKEETIRYQAGLAQQITNMILMMDGVIDASVQLSFPPEDVTVNQQAQVEPITAAVYVKHQGVYDDPNSHLENKIKRIVSGSVAGLNINDVTVVADRSRFTDVTVDPMLDKMAGNRDFVNIWNMVLSKQSAGKFRTIFFLLMSCAITLAVILGWLFWKFYPVIRRKGGFKELLKVSPITTLNDTDASNNSPPEV